MKLQEVTNYNLKSQTILNESWNVLTESQRLHVGAWEKRVWPLMEQLNTLLEAQLTADQIQQIFANAEKVSIEGGANLTALGKAGKVTAEVSSKMKAEIEKLLKQAANSEPVQNMDAQFDKLRGELANKVKTIKGGDKILAGVDKWKQFAEENPGKSAFIIGAMTSVLAFASGGLMSGAAIGFFLRLANNTIKGDKLSTAVGKATKTAAIGAFAGVLGDIMSDAVDVAEPAVEGGPQEVTAEVSSDDMSKAAGNNAEEVTQAISEMTADEYKLQYAQKIAENFKNMSDDMIQKIADNVVLEGQYPEEFNARFDGTVVRGNIYLTMEEANAFDKFVNNNDPFSSRGIMGNETTDWMKENVEGFREQAEANVAAQAAADAELKTRYDAMSPEEQKAFDDKRRDMEAMWGDPADYTPPGTPKYKTENIEFIEDRLHDEFALYEASLQEGPLGDAAKGFAKSVGGVVGAGAKAAGRGVAGAIKKGASAAGKELGQKITVRKLNKLWKTAGSPTDTGEIANVLAQAGLSDEQIGTIGQSNKVDLKPTTTTQEPAQNEPKADTPAQTGNTPSKVDLKSLASQIKKAGVADQVKKQLANKAFS